MISLDLAKGGARVKVREVLCAGASRRLYGMGIVPGAELEIVANSGHGPVIVRVRGVEVALGRGLARGILVEVLSSEEDNRGINRAA